ncbi:MAG: type II secretion system protein, partial [Verrucomicrobiales bacterium]
MKKGGRETTKGLSLVELLVVVAVLALLAGLGVPVGLKMREQARQAACLGQLRGLGVALEAYLGDHHGIMPELAMGRSSASEDVPVLEVVLRPYVASEEAFRCPADEEFYADSGSSYFWNHTQSGLRR